MAAEPDGLGVDDHQLLANASFLRIKRIVVSAVTGGGGVLFLCHMAFGDAVLEGTRGAVEGALAGARERGKKLNGQARGREQMCEA